MYLTCRNKTPLVSTMLESENNEKMIEFLKKSIMVPLNKATSIVPIPIPTIP